MGFGEDAQFGREGVGCDSGVIGYYTQEKDVWDVVFMAAEACRFAGAIAKEMYEDEDAGYTTVGEDLNCSSGTFTPC